ncbi:MAG: YIP1 family protein [Gemmatimonadota bacterium]
MDTDETRDTAQDPARTATGERSVLENFRDVIFAPSATFEEVGRRPHVLVPLIILMAAALVASYLLMPLWTELQQLRVMENPDLSSEQREAAISGMESFKWIGLVISPIGFAVVLALTALLFWGWAAISGAKNAEYKVAFGALTYASVVGVIQMYLQAAVIQIKGLEQVAREGGPPLFGLSLFLDRDDFPSLVWGQLANLNFFSIWYAVLIAIAGIHALRMSRGSATTIAVILFVIGGLFLSFQGAS